MNDIRLPSFPKRAGLQQRVLPEYRAAFFDLLAGACLGGLSVFAGEAGKEEGIVRAGGLQKADLTQAKNFHPFKASSPLYFCWQIGWSSWLERWQPEILVVETNPRTLSTRLAVRWMHARGRAVIGWGLGVPEASGTLLRRWISFLSTIDAVIAYSQRGAAEFRAIGIPGNRIFVAPNAVAPRPGAGPIGRPPGFNQKPLVLFVGRLQARKRVDHLIQACAALPEALKPRLVIVGDGPAKDGLSALARSVYPTAEFPGAVHGAELDPFYAAADLFVLPGTGGLAVQQAMAHSLPVIVAEGDGTQNDLVRPGNGAHIPPGDLPALINALERALSDPARLRLMGQESYRIVSEEVNLEAMVTAFVSAFTAVCSEGLLRAASGRRQE